MRVFIKKHILDLLNTVKEAVLYIEKSFEDKGTCIEVLKNCADALFSIESSLKSGFTMVNYQNNYESNVQYLIQSIEYIASKLLENKNIGEYKKDLFKKIELIVNEINNDDEVKLEVVFLPYKASMWDSLESVWLVAKDDDKCNTYVIPIPYYDRDSTGRLSVFHYEGNDFPSYVPIHDYKSYVISARKPDIIYIHNPYDGYNRVTSIAPEYYSDKLKKYTDMLVYIPYYVVGSYQSIELASNKIKTSAVVNSNLTIVQSNKYKKLFLECGFSEEKIQALGTPKLDIKKELDDFEGKEEWDRKLKNRKVILINLTLAVVLENDIWLDVFFDIIKELSENENIAIIFRPHPLIEATISSMKSHLVTKYIEIKNYIKSSENIILDLTSNPDIAFNYSDGMISTFSSLVFKYIITEKPTLILVNKKVEKIKDEFLLFDYLGSYFNLIKNELFLNEKDDFEVQDNLEYIEITNFVSMILEKSDYNRERRIGFVKDSIENIDGTCGKKIHSFVLNKLLGETKNG